MTEPTVKQIDLSQPDVLVVTPTIPGRDDLLKRAVASIREDMGHVVVAGAIEVDLGGLGPSITRNRAVVQTMNAGVRPKWIAFLDDDDEFLPRSEEHTSELQSLMRISYAVFCLKNKKNTNARS